MREVAPPTTLRYLAGFLDGLREVEGEWGFQLDDELAVRENTSGGLLTIVRIHPDPNDPGDSHFALEIKS